MRPGMPLGRKHFRRSRDAPILLPLATLTMARAIYGKGLLAVLFVKDLVPTLAGPVRRSIY